MTDERKIRMLELEIARLKAVLGTALTWIAQSAGSPLSVDDARRLIARLHEPYSEASDK